MATNQLGMIDVAHRLEASIAEQKFIPGISSAMRGLTRILERVAGTDVPVMILGESGTGKRVLATLIHQASPRVRDTFVEVNCADLMPAVLEPAGNGVEGAGPLRGTGTVLFNEVADLSPACQAKLSSMLSVLDGERSVPGVRLISTTRHDLENDIRGGRFREDLYYRLSSVCLRVPPLRHRREDIPLLAEFFLDKYSAQFTRPRPALTPPLLKFLNEHSWPRNVAELEDAIRTIVAIGDVRIATAALRASSNGHRGNSAVAAEPVSLKQAAKAASHHAERELILKVLSRTQWNRKRAALELKISYKALLYKMKQIGCSAEVGHVEGERK